MRISTSTGDFSQYKQTLAEKVRCFGGGRFRYINLEQTGYVPELMSENDDDWRRFAHELGEAAAEAGVTYVLSHAPCLDAFETLSDEHYQTTLRAIRRSIEVCHVLGISRTVVHPSSNETFGAEDFYRYNKRFYADMFDLMEKYDITVMLENMHKRPVYAFSTGAELREFLEDVNHPLLGVCWDTAHCNLNPVAREIEQYDHIVAIGDRLKGLHISDNLGDIGKGGHHHTWPFAGTINFDQIMQGLLDVNYDGYFNFEASYTLLHEKNSPRHRKAWEREGETVTRLLSPSVELKKKAVDLLYDIGKYMLETYDCFEE